jgi:hypothetical protein
MLLQTNWFQVINISLVVRAASAGCIINQAKMADAGFSP